MCPADPLAPVGEHLILYDGVCGLCNRLNQFVLPRDPEGVFLFASLQSAVGRSILQGFGRNPDDLNTFFVVKNHRSASPALMSKSGAALFVAKTLGAPWRWLGIFAVFPSTLLDWGYDLIARNRYRLFGRSATCWLPRPEYKNRFLDA